MTQRDRDTQGRARNARPRDALGRPLPRGSRGVDGVDETRARTPRESLAESQRLLADGRPFHAHEILEAAWKAAPDAERDLWQGLAQLAVGLTHVQRGNATGATALLRRGAERLDPFAADPPHDIDVRNLVDFAARLTARIERTGLAAVTADELVPTLVAAGPTDSL